MGHEVWGVRYGGIVWAQDNEVCGYGGWRWGWWNANMRYETQSDGCMVLSYRYDEYISMMGTHEISTTSTPLVTLNLKWLTKCFFKHVLEMCIFCKNIISCIISS